MPKMMPNDLALVYTIEQIYRTYTVPRRADGDYLNVAWVKANAIDADETCDGDEKVVDVS